MDISDVLNKQELCTHVMYELKNLGVKCRKEKSTKDQVVIFSNSRRIFRTCLQLLELTDVILANGSVVQIPKFVADACNRILEQVETEGIFRKAGSSLRQKEIRIMLETGMPLGRSHHVIDVANVVKYFFRELPEPLIPTTMQETLLRALLIGENSVKALILACILLPTATINTLRFFMQFLYTVSLNESVNKMSTENLAIIFTPGLMPFANINSLRFTNHIKVVQLLIENANSIGTIPMNIINKLRIIPKALSSDVQMGAKSQSIDHLNSTAKKKKKRRSGSLTHMFNGFKKIVGSTIGNSEDFEDAGPKKHVMMSETKIAESDSTTPCDKSRKKRKFPEPMSAFSTKKKKDLLALLPNDSGGFLPNTPLTKKSIKRASLNHNQQILNKNVNSFVSSVERRWSTVGSGWHKNKNTEVVGKRQGDLRMNIILHSESTDIPSNVYMDQGEMNTKDLCEHINDEPKSESSETYSSGNSETNQDVITGKIRVPENCSEGDYSKEISCNPWFSLEGIHTQYDQIFKESAFLSLHKTKELSHHPDLKLKCRSQQLDIRSPSTRKIGSVRRRSQDKFALKHTKSTAVTNNERERLKNTYTKTNLKRTRQSIGPIFTSQDTHKKCVKDGNSFDKKEKWMSGEYFFRNMTSTDELLNDRHELSIIKHIDHVTSPVNNIPKNSTTSPEFFFRNAMKAASTSKVQFVNRIAASNGMVDDACGRASISRLRTKNAGMVMAKAKLFDRLGGCNIELQSGINDRRYFSTNHQSIDASNKSGKDHDVKYHNPVSENIAVKTEREKVENEILTANMQALTFALRK